MIHVALEDHVALVRLDRPERLNALGPEANDRIVEIWRELAADRRVRACIVTGTGERAFCAGYDIKSEEPYTLDQAPVGGLTKELPFYKPVIAAVNGLAYGGGLEIVLAADLRVAVPHATFALTEVRLGLIPGGGGTVRLPYNVPWAIASDMILRARVLDAEEALRFGLVNAVVEPDQLLATARTWAQEIAALGPLAVRTAKETMWRTRGMDPDAALRFEERMSYAVQVSEDADEGMRAFAEGRAPSFRDGA